MTFSEHNPQQRTKTSETDSLKNASQLQNSYSGSPDHLIASNDTQGFARGSGTGKAFEPEEIEPVKETKCGPATRPPLCSLDQNLGKPVDTGPLPENHWSLPFANQTEGVPTIPQAPTSVAMSGQTSDSEKSRQNLEDPTLEGEQPDYQERYAELRRRMIYGDWPKTEEDSINLHLDGYENDTKPTQYNQEGNTATSKTTLMKRKDATISGNTRVDAENRSVEGGIELEKGQKRYFTSGEAEFTSTGQIGNVQIRAGVGLPLDSNNKKKGGRRRKRGRKF